MQPNQVEIDEALAASLLYDDPESIIYDEVTARQIQQREEVNGSTSLHCGSSSHQQGHVGGSIDTSSHSFQSPPPSGDVDPDNMTYEELNELGESIGAVNKGLSKSRIDQIPTYKFGASSWFRKKASSSGETECSICLIEFKKGDTISTLPCAHIYHKECISHWLEENKICCVCKAEVGP
ncbi:E3 ubiquitin-protein ligase BIG BROTHER [Brassica rapa]|nr:E3 ubiquitin-protein ligase BIG BROTHER [Brassica rapa]